MKNPTYREVCTKRTGHYEAVHVVFDPKQVSFEELARVFFETHDPTQRDGQAQMWRNTAVLYSSRMRHNVKQLRSSRTLIAKGYDVATEILPAAEFYSAENYHQDYYDNKGGTPYCHAPRKLF